MERPPAANGKADTAHEGPPKDAPAAAKREEKGKVTVPKDEYEVLAAKARERDDFQDKYVRAHAEFENVKKRLERQGADFLKYAKEEFVTEFLPIVDSIESALRHAEGAPKDSGALNEGLVMIGRQVEKFLKGLGVEKVRTVGEKFDPHLHEALEVAEDPKAAEGTIVGELKAGYTLYGKLVRPAAVKIVKRGVQKTEDREQETEDREQETEDRGQRRTTDL